MKPAPFEYYCPTTKGEALALLGQHGEDAKLLAGGQSLVPMLNFRLARPQVLIDINRVQELVFLEESDNGLRIGALVRHRTLEISPLVQQKCALLSHAARFIGHVTIRNRGTFGGSLAHADPSAELPLVLAALEGHIVAESSGGRRTLSPSEFFISYLTTSLQTTEILSEIWVPALSPRTGWGFQELALQHGAFAMVASAAILTVDENDVCSNARLVLGNVAPTPVRATASEYHLKGKSLTPKVLGEAAEKVTEVVEATADIHASAEYRTEMAKVFARRALQDAYHRLGQGRGAGAG